MKNVYDPAQQSYRVDFACRVILSGAETTRLFNTCLEMGDDVAVAARIYKRALKNPRLMAALPKYIDLDFCKESYSKSAFTISPPKH